MKSQQNEHHNRRDVQGPGYDDDADYHRNYYGSNPGRDGVDFGTRGRDRGTGRSGGRSGLRPVRRPKHVLNLNYADENGGYLVSDE